MFQEMINGSIAVLTKPSVATFEEHEKDNLTWALIYAVIAGVINAVLTALKDIIFPPPDGAANVGLVSLVLGGIIGTIIVLLISWGITYALGRAFGGTGQFGELAYDLALFGAPLTVIGSILNLIPVLGSLAALVLGIYNLYLTYLGIQSGMNLPKEKALYVIGIEFAIAVVLGICVFVALGAAIMGSGALDR